MYPKHYVFIVGGISQINQNFSSRLESGFQITVHKNIDFIYFSNKTFVFGTQKNRLNETVLLSTQNKGIS